MILAVGTVWKNNAGRWHAKLEIGHPNDNCSFEVKAEKRMKDAIRVANAWAKKLGWAMECPWLKQ